VEENPFNLLYVLRVIRQYLVYILVVVGLSGLLAFILTLPAIYPPEYRSSAIIYPTSAERYDLFNMFHEEPNMYLYGGAKEVEKLDNIANSDPVRFFVIDSLDLWQAYGVDPENDASPRYYVLRTYNGNVKTTRVSGNGLEIEAYDVDPERAAAIVNLVIAQVDAINKDMLVSNKEHLLGLYRQSAARLQGQIAQYEDSARALRAEYNVLASLTQSEVIAEQVLMAEGDLGAARAALREAQRKGQATAGLEMEVRRLEGKVAALTRRSSGSAMNLEKFRDGMDKVKAVEDVLTSLAEDLKNLAERVQYLELMDQVAYSTILIPEQAQPADKKARPVRWVILLATLLIASLVSIMGTVLIDRLIHWGKNAQSASAGAVS